MRYIFVVQPQNPHITPKKFFSQFRKDDLGRPLYVKTRRGIEHPIKVDPSVNLKNDGNGVPRVATYQGQRELIYEIGFILTLIEAYKYNVPVFCYKYEKNMKGLEDHIKTYIYSNLSIIKYITAIKNIEFKYYLIKNNFSEYIDNNFSFM